MALQYLSGGPGGTWTNYTAGTTPLPNTDTLYFRDTAVSLASTVSLGSIALPRAASSIIHCLVSVTSGTVTAGTAEVVWEAQGGTFVSGAEPDPAGSTATSTPATLTVTADTNTYGFVHTCCPMNFHIRIRGFTGTATVATYAIEVQLVR